MVCKNVTGLLADLGVGRSHSRPRTPNDNPFSEAQFKTLKYCPAFPERFSSFPAAQRFCLYAAPFTGYSGVRLHTPATVDDSAAIEIRAYWAKVLRDAYAANL